jgi:DNA-binding NarL/FixJ family response regulator
VTTSVLVVDDQPLFCSGMRLLIEGQRDLAFAGAAHSGAEAVEAAVRARPDVVLMDLRMPDGNGLTATRRILERLPATRIVVLTTFRDQGAVQRALDAGAAGFITKDATPDELLRAVRDVAAGRPVTQAARVTPMLPDPLYAAVPEVEAIEVLTAREQEMFLHVARGLTNAQIASLAGISENTVRNHVSSLLQKLDLQTRNQVPAFAHRHGLLRIRSGA